MKKNKMNKNKIIIAIIFLIVVLIVMITSIINIKSTNYQTIESKIKYIEKKAKNWGQNNKSELNYKCEVDGILYDNCAILSIKDLLEKNIIKEDKLDEEGNKILINPKTQESMNANYIAIYINKNKVSTKYNILDGEAYLLARKNEHSRENFYIFIDYISEIHFVNYIDKKYNNINCDETSNAWCVGDDTKKNTKVSDIIAWIEPSLNKENYILYIGSNKRIYAPVISSYLFSNFTKLEKINFINFDTSKTLDMHWMFLNNPKLTQLNLNNFNTTNVVNMSYMFADSSNIKTLDLSSFYTTKTFRMIGMFYNCEKLEELNISNFKIKKETFIENVFKNTNALKSIKIKDKESREILRKATNSKVIFSK